MNVYFGSYTQPHAFVPGARGAGIAVCDFNPVNGELTFRGATNILNPSYLALDLENENLFAVSENFDAEGSVHVFKRRRDGSLLPINSQPSAGRAACHICVTSGGQVCVSSYLDGFETIHPVGNNKLGLQERLFRYERKEKNAAGTSLSHAHQAVVSPDGRWLYICDCGLDGIWCHVLVNGRVTSTPPAFISAPAGSGPRHLVFHTKLPRVYVICELNAHLLTFHWDGSSGSLSLADDLLSLPEDWQGQPAAAAIRMHPSASALFVSNRNHDSLTAFRLDHDGNATFADCIPAGGKTPRDFAIDPSGRWLLCANQNSNHIAIHKLDRKNGLPSHDAPAFFSIATPVCVLFAA